MQFLSTKGVLFTIAACAVATNALPSSFPSLPDDTRALFSKTGISQRQQAKVDRAAKIPALLQKKRHEKYGRSDGCKDKLKPKIFIISLFEPEFDIWNSNGNLGLGALNVTVPNHSLFFPTIECDRSGEICHMGTGESEINAASSMSALVLSPYFDLTTTYFMTAGIAGVNPHVGTINSVTFARYAVQFALEYEFDERVMPQNWTSGYVPLGSVSPEQYPSIIYGTEVFELNKELRDRAVMLAKRAHLNDSDVSVKYRALYDYKPANQGPKVLACDVGTSDAYWIGNSIGEGFGNYTLLMTNGTGNYCSTAQEDNAVLEVLKRSHKSGLVDFARIIVMRTSAAFDRAPPGVSDMQHLLVNDEGAFGPSLQNIYNTGIEVVDDVVKNWEEVYEKGVKASNFVGDILWEINASGVKPDIGGSVTVIG